MTLRVNEIGADVYSTTETKLDKNNLGTQPNELEHEYEYPELAPGRALLDVETGALYEIMHRIVGVTDTVSGLQSEREEYNNWKYRTPEGQDWGGVIQHYFISYAKRQCPTPNEHGELQMPLTRPDESEITDISPPAFETSVLFNDDNMPRPFLLLERPEVTYEEVMPGESYNILGWYDPSATDASNRINPTETIAHQFPDIVGVDYTMDISKAFPELGIEISWNDNTDSKVVEIDSDADGFAVDESASPGNFHVFLGHSNGETQLMIDSPFDAKEDIKSLNGCAGWDPAQKFWTVKSTRDALVEMVRELTNDGWTLTFEGDVLAAHGDTDVTVHPDQEVDLSVAEIFEYTFTDLVEVGTGISLPGINAEIDTDDITTDIVRFTADDTGVSMAEADERGDNHAVMLTDEQFGLDCPEDNASIVKSLDWKQSRYEWKNEHEHWTVKTNTAVDLISAFLAENEPVTVPVEIIEALGDEEPITEDRPVTIDENAVTHLDTYTGPDASTDANDISSLSDDSITDAQTIHGTHVANENSLSLMALDMALADTDTGMSVDIGGDLPGLPSSVTEEWQPSADSEDAAYGWYHPMTSARIIVEETNGWGTEYDISVKTADARDAEHIVTIADERTAALTAITHLKALTR